MTLKTTVTSINRKDLLALNRTLRQSCSIHIGENRSVSIRTTNRPSKIMGSFTADDNTIKIFRNEVSDINKYLETFIHEWTHSKQLGLKKNYNKLNKKLGYDKNPYEVEARNNEKIFRSKVWKTVKLILKNGNN